MFGGKQLVADVCLVPAFILRLSGEKVQPNPALQEEINQYCVNIRSSSAHRSLILPIGAVYPHSTYRPQWNQFKQVKDLKAAKSFMKKKKTI